MDRGYVGENIEQRQEFGVLQPRELEYFLDVVDLRQHLSEDTLSQVKLVVIADDYLILFVLIVAGCILIPKVDRQCTGQLIAVEKDVDLVRSNYFTVGIHILLQYHFTLIHLEDSE